MQILGRDERQNVQTKYSKIKKKLAKVLMLEKKKCSEDGECRFQEGMKDKKVRTK